MLRVKAPNRFKNLDEKWRICYLEGNRYYPESMMVKHQGNWYCKDCWAFRFHKEEQDKFIPKVTDDLS